MAVIQKTNLMHDNRAIVRIGAQEPEFLTVGENTDLIILNISKTPCFLSLILPSDAVDYEFFAENMKFAQLKFSKLDDSILYTVANDNQPIGDRLNIKGITEDTLKTFAEYEFSDREKERVRRRERKSGMGWGTFFDMLTCQIIYVIREICHADQE